MQLAYREAFITSVYAAMPILAFLVQLNLSARSTGESNR